MLMGMSFRGRTNIIDANNIEFVPLTDAEQAMISVTGKPGDQSFMKDMLDLTMRMLIGVRTISVNYSKNGGTVLPGYLPEPVFLGAGKYSPDPELFNGSFPTDLLRVCLSFWVARSEILRRTAAKMVGLPPIQH